MPAGGRSVARSIVLSGRTVAYTLRHSARRSLGLTIDARGLTVAVPLRTPLVETEAFLLSKSAWIVQKLDFWAQRHVQPLFSLEDGAQFPVFGEPCLLRWEPKAARAQWHVGPHGRELCLPQRPDEARARLLLRRVLQDYALGDFADRLHVYLGKLDALHPGIPAPRLGLSSARTRWGSCSSRSGIRLNWRLIHFPPVLIDYVVAHEVAHLVEMNHSPRFWAVVGALYPGYDAARAAIKRLAPSLPLI